MKFHNGTQKIHRISSKHPVCPLIDRINLHGSAILEGPDMLVTKAVRAIDSCHLDNIC